MLPNADRSHIGWFTLSNSRVPLERERENNPREQNLVWSTSYIQVVELSFFNVFFSRFEIQVGFERI